MYAIIAEDKSDADTLKVLAKRLARDNGLAVRTKGYGGCGAMLTKGARDLRTFADLGCTQFIVCYDADREDPVARYREAFEKIVRPSELESCCILVPVQEVEAWILADVEQVSHIISRWNPGPISNPEAIDSPKEYLENLSDGENRKPRYSHAIHNCSIAKHLRLEIVHRKCPSFRPLVDHFQQVEQQRLPGKWIAHSIVFDGSPHSDSYEIEIADGRLDVHTADSPLAAAWKSRFVSEPQPSSFELTPFQGTTVGKRHFGVYEWTSDGFRICLATIPGVSVNSFDAVAGRLIAQLRRI